MGSGTNFGMAILALGELGRMDREVAEAKWAARRAQEIARQAQEIAWQAQEDLQEATDQNNAYILAAKSHVHGLRAKIRAHQIVEDRLIAALKAENANHPLASREAVDKAVMDEYTRQLFNPEVIKRTYPDGKLPEGAVIPPNKVWTIAPSIDPFQGDL